MGTSIMRYRKIDVRVWFDDKFRSLSDDGKLIWFYLLSNPNTTAIPGLYRLSAEAAAADLGWTLERWLKGFAEPFRKGMAKADWTAHVVYIPNAIRYNPPENPNVVKGWTTALDEIPDCPLKNEAMERVWQTLPKGFPKPFRKGLPNQEQEQEQDQEQEQEQKQEQEQEQEQEQKQETPRTPRRALSRADMVGMLTARGVTETTAAAFVEIRMAKRAPLTQVAVSRLEAEAKKASMTLEAAIAECCMRGWQGFRADWMRSGQPRKTDDGWERSLGR